MGVRIPEGWGGDVADDDDGEEVDSGNGAGRGKGGRGRMGGGGGMRGGREDISWDKNTIMITVPTPSPDSLSSSASASGSISGSGPSGNGGGGSEMMQIANPRMRRSIRGKEVKLNDLGYRMTWHQSRVFSGRVVFLQKACELVIFYF